MADTPAPNQMSYFVDDSGETVAIPHTQAQQAVQQGYRPASAEEVKSFGDAIKFGNRPGSAAALGALRGLTLGLSDLALTKTGIAKPETIRKIEEQNPEASTVGEVGAIGASMLTGEGEASLLGKAAEGVAAPINAVSKLGTATTRAVEAALPEATSTLGKAGKIALSHGAGGAVEGAAFGAGRAVTDYAEDNLGDPDQVGEHVLSNVGMSAILGGGMGSALGLTGAAAKAGMGRLKGMMPGGEPLPPSGPAIIKTPEGPVAESLAPEGTLERSMQEAGFPSDKREEVANLSNSLKPNAKQIISDAEVAGLPVMEGQISAKKSVQHVQTMLLDRPGMAGEQQRAIFDKGWNGAARNFEEALQTGEDASAHEAGVQAKDLIKEQIDSTYKPIQERYDRLGATNQALEIPDEARLRIVSDLLEESENATKGSVGGPRQKQFEQWAEKITNQKTLANFNSLETEIGNAERAAWRSGNYDDAHAMSEIKGILRDFTGEQIDAAHIRLAREAGMPESEALQLAKEMKTERASLRKEYSKFVDTIGELSGAVKLGKARTYREAMQALEKIEPSKLAANAFRGDRINALRRLEKDFPGAFEIFKNQYKKELMEDLVKDGVVNPRKAAKEFSKIPKEIQQMLFEPGQIEKMKATKGWLEALPEDWAPSKTPRGMMYMEHFASPVKAVASEAMGFAQAAYLKHSVQEMHALNQVEKAAKKSQSEIIGKAKKIFSEIGEKKNRLVGFAAKEMTIDRDQKKKMINQIQMLKSNPDKFVELLEKNTNGIYSVAPKTSGAVHQAAVRAVQYLADAAPKLDSDYPLGSKPEPSNMDLRIFAERLHLLDNPSSVLEEISQGTLVPAHVEALSQVYPSLYNDMKTAVVDHLSDAIASKKLIPQTTKNMLSLFLNQDLDESITPQAIMQNQAAITRSHMRDQAQQQMAAGNMKPTQTGLGKLTKSTQAMTAMQKSSQRIES